MSSIEFFVPGLAKTAGSKKAIPMFSGQGPGRTFVRSLVVDDTGAAGKNWRAVVQLFAKQALPPNFLLRCPINLHLTFRQVRPKSHWGKKGLKASAPALPTTRPDVLKLARAVEDALTGIVWVDDAQICTETLWKRYGENPGVMVCISEDTG